MIKKPRRAAAAALRNWLRTLVHSSTRSLSRGEEDPLVLGAVVARVQGLWEGWGRAEEHLRRGWGGLGRAREG